MPTASKSKQYVVLRSSKLSSKPVTKQGKVVNMKCSSSKVASKYAAAVYQKSHRKIKSVTLYRKGRISKYRISCKFKSGKMKFAAKLTSSKTVKKSHKTMKKTKKRRKSRRSKKTLRKRPSKKHCPDGSRRSRTAKTCQSSALALRRKISAASKAQTKLHHAKVSLASAKRHLTKCKKRVSKTKPRTKSRSAAKKHLKKCKGIVSRKKKTVSRLKKVSKKRTSAVRSAKKSLVV